MRKYFRNYSLDHYSALWTSLQVKPDTVRISELLTSEMDTQAQAQLSNIWRRGLRDHGSINRIIAPVDKAHFHNSPQIWRAALSATAHQSPSDLPMVYTSLAPKLAEIPRQAVDLAIRIVLKRPSATELPKFLEQVPDHVLRDLIQKNIRFWGSAASPETFAQIVIPLARRGSFPKSTEGVETLGILSKQNMSRYIDSLTQFLAESKVCTGLSTHLCLFVIENSSTIQLDKFVKAARNAQQAPNKAHPFNYKVLAGLEKRNPSLAEPFDRYNLTISRALAADTVPQAYNNIVNWSPQLRNHPRDFTRLYANWLRCCARDSPHDLARFYESAQTSVFEQLGHTVGRERVLLSGAIQGLVSTRNWVLVRDYIHAIKKTSTPFLWNAALCATKNWDIVSEMQSKNIELNTASMRALISSGDILDFKRLLQLQNGFLPQKIISEFIEIVNKKNLYCYTDLVKFYRQVFEILLASMKGRYEFIFPILGPEVVSAVVWGALRTKPKEPWVVIHFIKENMDLGLITEDSVASGISNSLEKLQGDDGTAVHIRNHSLVSVPKLINKFNSEWKGLMV